MEKKKKTEIQTSCDTCAYLIYDEEYEEYVCDVSMDEDEIARLYGDSHYTHRCSGNRAGSVNPIRSKTKQKTIQLPAVFSGRLLEPYGNVRPR